MIRTPVMTEMQISDKQIIAQGKIKHWTHATSLQH